MTWEEKIFYERLEAKEEGKAEGKAEGEARLATLINKLISAGRNDDVLLATRDETARKELYQEFGICD